MDDAKCRALKAELASQPEPQVVPIEKFFDGNDDESSIGCNLIPHPGIDAFREILTGLLRRSDVDSVYAQVSEVDPGEGYWPFAAIVLVTGAIATEDLAALVSHLQPDDIGPAEDYGVAPKLLEQYGPTLSAIWWD